MGAPRHRLARRVTTFDEVIAANKDALSQQGKQIFRFDTFGDEAFWGDTLRLHEAIAGAAYGGVGPGVSPAQALALGLKVDVNAVPARSLRRCGWQTRSQRSREHDRAAEGECGCRRDCVPECHGSVRSMGSSARSVIPPWTIRSRRHWQPAGRMGES